MALSRPARGCILLFLFLLLSRTSAAQQTCTPGGLPKTATAMRIWLDALDVHADNNATAAPANNSDLSFWKDKSGNFINFSQAITASKPKYISNLGGFPAVYFNDITGGPKHTLNPVVPQNNLQNGTVFFVFQGKKITGQSSNVLMEDKRNSGDGSLRYAQYPDKDTIGFTLYTVADYKSNIASPYDETAILSFSKATANATVEIRAKDKSGSVSIGSNTRMIPIGSLGTNTSTAADYTNGYFFEALVYDNYLNTAQTKIIENHLAAKYSGATGTSLPVPAPLYIGAYAADGNYDYDVIGVGSDLDGMTLQADNSFGFSMTGLSPMLMGSYLLIGHNDQARTAGKGWVNTTILGQTGLQQQFDRTWYFDVTSLPFLQTISFDFSKAKSPIVPSSEACKYLLLYRTGTSGTWTSLATANTVNGTTVTFNNPYYYDGYYTIGQIEKVLDNNIISASQTINCGSSPVLTGTVPTGGFVYTYQWQQSADGISNWTDGAGSSTAQNYTPPASGNTTWYRRIVSNYTCFNTSNVIQVTVNTVNTGNVIELNTPANTTICYNTAPGQMLTSGSALGSTYTYQWQQQLSGTASWTDIAGSTAESYTPGSLTVSTSFRRIATTTGTPKCSHTSNVLAVAVNPYAPQQGPIQGPDSVCQAATGVVYQVAGTAGATYNWTYSGTSATITSGANTEAITVNYATGATPGSWTVTMVQNGCSALPSVAYPVVIKPAPVVNTVTNKDVCSGTASGAIHFSGSVTPATYHWTNNQISIGLAASGTGDITSFTATNTGLTNVAATVTVTATGAQCTGVPVQFTINAHPKPQGSILSDTTICEGDPVQLTFNPTAGTGPFKLIINGISYTGIQSGIPFAIPAPTQTTIYNLTSITDLFNCINP